LRGIYLGLLKLGRNYNLIVTTPDGTQLTINPPFTLEFDITRTVLTSANVCQLRIYNLSQNNRNLLRYDFSNFDQPSFVQLRAGYGDNLPVIFAGNISQAWSVREGTNYITTVECFDGGYAFVNGVVTNGAGPFPPGTPWESVYKALMSDLPKVAFGAISDNYLKTPAGVIYTVGARSLSFTGNPAQVLTELTGGGFFIDNSKSYIMGDNYVTSGAFTKIDASTGLLNTPIKENFIINLDMIFEPRIQICQYISLVSTTADLIGAGANAQSVNGNYKVASVKHRGIISPVTSGDAVTSVGLFTGYSQLETGAVTQ
jgi:hypothetical protein